MALRNPLYLFLHLILFPTRCPATGNIFGLAQGLQYLNDNNFLYKSQTPLFVLASEAPPNNLVVISCYVQYCDGNKGSNPRCTDVSRSVISFFLCSRASLFCVTFDFLQSSYIRLTCK